MPIGAIRAVLFDLGGVIWESPLVGLNRYEASAGLPPGIVGWLNTQNPDDNAWARYERAQVDAAGFRTLFEAEALVHGHVVDGAAILDALAGPIRPAMLRAVSRLRAAGLRTAAGTNNFSPLDEADPVIADLLARFDVVVQSAIEGVRKPEPAFYELVMARLGVDAAGLAFLDDLGVNLKAARAMGITTIKVADPDDALRELQELTGVPLIDD
jgi:putative hydrolase of the HAD superfamily